MKKVIAYFHTHWDREWYKTRVEFNFRLVKVFDDVLNKLVNAELPYFYFDGQVSALLDYLKIRPEKEKTVKKLIKENKLAIGPFYCSTDSFLVSIQSMLANLDLGIKVSRDFGCDKYIGYCADTFGHSKSLPTIFNYYNFKGGIFWRGLGNLPCCFNWNGLKSIYLRQGYFHDYLNLDLPCQKKAELIENQLQKIDDGSKILLLPLGADHLKVANNIKEQIKDINKCLKNYELIIENPFEYIEKVVPQKTFQDELYDNSRNFLLSGVFSSRIDIKQMNSYSQWNLLRIAEPLNALCYNKKLIKENYQPQINYAKEMLIKNHAHDSIYGCSIDDVHKDMLPRFSIVHQTANSVIENILFELEEKTNSISVINLSDFEFSGLCSIKTDKKFKNTQLVKKDFYVDRNLSLDINKIPVTEDFKPIYTYLFEVKNLKPFSISKIDLINEKSDLKITDKSIENSKIKLLIKNNKLELLDKKTNKIYKNFIGIVDNADVGDSYNFAPLKNDKSIKAEITGSKVILKKNLRSTLRIDFNINIPKTSKQDTRSKQTITHKMQMFITLDKNSDFLKFKIKWVNKSLNHILKVVFNFEKSIEKTISDDMLGTIERTFDTDYNIADYVPAKRGIELKTNSRAFQTFVMAEGVGVITKGLNEYTPYKNTLSITILRATNVISNPKNPARGTPAGPPIQTPDLQQLKENEVDFAIIFSEDENEVKKTQQQFYGSTIAFHGDIDETLLSTTSDVLTVTYDEKLQVRIFDKKKGRIYDL